jgi:hypothetical protein
MSRIVVILGVLFFITWCSGSEPAADKVIVIGGYSITIPASWEKTDPDPKMPNTVAKRYEKKGEGKVCIGEIWAMHLKGPVDKESTELVDSIGGNSKISKALEIGKFTLQNGTRVKKVIVSIMAEDTNYKAPQIFYSVYLQKSNGSCVTFKLRCTESRFEDLRKEFEDIISKVKQASSNNPAGSHAK